MKCHYYNPSAVMRISGPDAYTYLQGQFSNDLRQPPGAAVYGLWLDHKGRVLGDSTVLRLTEEEFCAVSRYTPRETLRSRLERFIIADDVQLSDETEAWAAAELWGEGLGKFRGDAGEVVLPETGRFVRWGNSIVFARHSVDTPSYSVLFPRPEAEKFRHLCQQSGGTPLTVDEAEAARITAGIPAVPLDLGPADLPQEGGLDTAVISYTKGCYVGQEVMARLKNLGRTRRRLHVVAGAGTPPGMHTPLFQQEKKCGDLRTAARTADGFVALAMLSLAGLDAAAGLWPAAGEAPAWRILRPV
jgi:folate-binding protein YgfZ